MSLQVTLEKLHDKLHICVHTHTGDGRRLSSFLSPEDAREAAAHLLAYARAVDDASVRTGER
jgi:hypothetical protein